MTTGRGWCTPPLCGRPESSCQAGCLSFNTFPHLPACSPCQHGGRDANPPPPPPPTGPSYNWFLTCIASIWRALPSRDRSSTSSTSSSKVAHRAAGQAVSCASGPHVAERTTIPSSSTSPPPRSPSSLCTVHASSMGTVEDAEARVRWLGTIAGTYVRAAAADLRARGVSPKFRRERFLLAMPVFGTGCVKRSTVDVGATAPVV